MLRSSIINEIKELDYLGKNDFELIERIFHLAKTLSRNTEFAKADSYNGLIKLYKKQLERNFNQELKDKIFNLENKKKEINSKLGRRVKE